MSRPRRRHRLYQQARRLLRQTHKDGAIRLPKIREIIRKTIKDWLEADSSFTAKYFGTYLIIHDASCGTQLAVIEFGEDHLVINVPLLQDDNYLARLSLLIGMASDGQKILYSDPGLRTRVKFVVNQAHQRQGR